MATRARLPGQFSWLKPFIYTVFVVLAVAGLARLGYIAWLGGRVTATGGTGFILLQGARFDLLTLGYLLAIPAGLTPLLNSFPAVAAGWQRVLGCYLVATLAALTFMEVVTPTFIAEYDVRPNFLFVEYLKYPQELVSMLLTGYKLQVLAALILVPAVAWPAALGLQRQMRQVQGTKPWLAVPMSLLALVVCTAAARSTLDHRPVNPSTVAYSSDTLVNSLPLNSLYSVANAVYEMRHEDSGFAYGEVGEPEAVAAVRSEMHVPIGAFKNEAIPTLRDQRPNGAGAQRRNLVIVIEESLGAEFVGALGGLPLTPNLDDLVDEGIWFENLYATGTRSARGLEAIVAGFPPTTSQSVLKLSRAQEDFFTIGEFLRRKGYATSFIYGGEAQFDNMRWFFANNGFDTILDKHDFVNPTFMGSWGVADEDVFEYAHQYYQSMDADEPFASVLFTTSNHSPWEFPDDRIELYEQPKATRNNSVKYADYALGQFIRKAKDSRYWENTIFLVVSDHNSRVYGADLVPIARFHIPALILGGAVQAQRVSRVASQIDLLPTLLSMIGVGGEHPAPGLDLTRPDIADIPARAVMQYGDTQAYRIDDQVVILRKESPPALFSFTDGRYVAMPGDAALLQHAKAMAAWPSIAYRQREYRLPGS